MLTEFQYVVWRTSADNTVAEKSFVKNRSISNSNCIVLKLFTHFLRQLVHSSRDDVNKNVEMSKTPHECFCL